MQHVSLRLLRACAACQALDGAASSTLPHQSIEYEATIWARPGESTSGQVLQYRCRACGVRLKRFTRTCALDGWLVAPVAPGEALPDSN